MPQRKTLTAIFAILCLFSAGDQVWCGKENTTDICTKGLKTTTLDVGDPINAATGEYYFHKRLFDLGGPLPLDFRLYYGSQFSQQTTANSLPLRFDGNHTPLLYVVDDFEDPTIKRGFISLGKGEEILASKAPTDAEWQVSTAKATPYKLKETADYFYLLDPSRDLIYTFKKAVPLGSIKFAYASRIEDRNGNALTYENPGGISTRVSDGLGRELKFTYTPYQYSNAGSSTLYQRSYLDRIEDQAGRVWTLTYETDEDERNHTSDPPYVIRSMTDPMGNVTRFAYGGRKRITSITRPEGNIPFVNIYDGTYTFGVVQTQADAYGNITTLTRNVFDPTETQFAASYPDGTSEVYVHTHSGRVMKGLTDATNKSAGFQADPVSDRVIGVTDRLGDTTSFVHHPETGRPLSVTNAKGDVLVYTYTPRDQTFTNPLNSEQVTFTFHDLTRIDYPDGTNEQFTHDAKGNMLTQIDPAGKTWTYTYNARGQVLTATNPAGGVVTNTYNADATPAARTDSDTGATTYGYDAHKRLNRITRPDATFTQITYDLNDRLTSIRDENNHTYTYTYDANGNLTGVTDPKGNLTQYAYDLMDRVVGTSDRLNKQTVAMYDEMGRITSLTDPNNLVTTYGYDPRRWQNRLSIGGQTWQTGHDDESVVASRTTPSGHVTTFESDKLGFLTGITDPLNQTTTLARDSMNRITGVTDPLNRTTRYDYDGTGLLSAVTSPGIGAATYGRNDLGRVNAITDFNGQDWTFGHTSMGRLASLQDPLGNTTDFGYDGRGRLSQVAYADGSTAALTRDAAGNVTRRQYTGGPDLQFTYDELNRLLAANDIALARDAEGRITSTDNAGTAFRATYDDGGRLKTATYNNGLFTVTYTYDGLTGLMTGVTDNLTSTHVGFTYDNDRKITAITRPNGVNTVYTYDNAGRITRIQDGAIIDLKYTLDAAGQVAALEMTTPLDPGPLLAAGAEEFTYDLASQVSSAGYNYDARGRLTASPGETFTWDGASRLAGIGATALTYNGEGDVLTRTSGGTTIHYHYNYALGLDPIVAEKNDSTGQFLRYYVWTPGGSLLYMIDAADSNKVSFYHFDRTGSTLALTGSAGTVSDSYAYAPYGELLRHQGTSQQPFTFVGQWGVRQEGTRLYQMRARYYDAETARFLTRDPMWPSHAEAKELNAYLYGLNNPVSFIDPLGKKGFLAELFSEVTGLGVIDAPTSAWGVLFFMLEGTPTGFAEGDPEWGFGNPQVGYLTREQFEKRQADEARERAARESERRAEEEEARRAAEWADPVRREALLSRFIQNFRGDPDKADLIRKAEGELARMNPPPVTTPSAHVGNRETPRKADESSKRSAP